MAQKGKAKRYDEAIKVAQETYSTQPIYKELLEKIFPELQELEDEYYRDVNKAVDSYFNEEYAEELHDFLKSLKDRVQPRPIQEWSEDDERICRCIVREQEEALDAVCKDRYGHSEIISDLKEKYRDRIKWLTSLKSRIEC